MKNVEPVLASGYDSTLPNHVADIVCAIDMSFGIQGPTEFLGELKHIARPDGVLVIDDGHQSREETKRKILASGHWTMRRRHAIT